MTQSIQNTHNFYQEKKKKSQRLFFYYQDDAQLYGHLESILIEFFQYNISINRSRGVNFRKGKSWLFHTLKELHERFPSFSLWKLRKALKNLISMDILTTGNFNDSRWSRRLWYAFVDEKKFLPKAEMDRNIELKKCLPFVSHHKSHIQKKEEKKEPPNPLIVHKNVHNPKAKAPIKNKFNKIPSKKKPEEKLKETLVQHGNFVWLRPSEYKKLLDVKSKEIVDALIEEMNRWSIKKEANERYRNYFGGLKAWISRREKWDEDKTNRKNFIESNKAWFRDMGHIPSINGRSVRAVKKGVEFEFDYNSMQMVSYGEDNFINLTTNYLRKWKRELYGIPSVGIEQYFVQQKFQSRQ